MILATDTHYSKNQTCTAGVLFHNWSDTEPSAVQVEKHEARAAQYEPGAFFLRELPFILSLLKRLPSPPLTIIVDGYVYLDSENRKGLGAHLFDVLDRKTPVIGVAKKPFAGGSHAVAICRGASKRPLFITAAGIPLSKAADAIGAMSGDHRQPTLLKLADRLCREKQIKCLGEANDQAGQTPE